MAYQAISAVGVAGTNALVSKKQAKNLEEEMERMRTDMARYNEVGIASGSDSNYVLQQEIQRLKAELAAQQPTSIDSIGGISSLEAEIAQLRQDLDTYKNDNDPIAREVPTKSITEPELSNNSVVNNLLSMQLEKIFFNVNEVTVKPVYHKTLQFVARSLNSHPTLGLQIDGYTDKTGAIATNQRLSLLRANAVKNYLLQQNVNIDQLYVNSFGEKMPFANNSTTSGQILNRRVELKFVQPALAQN
ncbi:OmpA family protein [Niabella ginsengisoli]|uniref:OmpA family protein n=1 Tax=Niabella ginsengisoli TaxID=522298 RepID=A0ABS9SGF1_9BACT|nr:OmpA family protein [Niabella ginsengisoli]MCH5597444.1 OmpA family protein [Niabella ginsengisoli]